ncbi:Transcription factor IIIA, partial [Stegodyphus mimosarum]
MSKTHKLYVCPHENCNGVFKRHTRYESHLRVHSGERPFICPFDECDKSYTRAFHLNRHMKIHESSFRCSVDGCSEILKSEATLKKHVDLIHRKKRHKIFKCSYCDKEFNKHNWLQKHEYIHTGIRPFLCPADNCERRFLVPSKLKKHMKVHEGYACTKPGCDKTFLKWSLLVKHNVINHPKVHKCASCNKEFSRSSNLKEHEFVHKEEREVFDCPVPNCSRFYFLKRNLKNHIKSYHEARPFVCKEEHCSKAFKTEADLSKHALRHDPNRPLRKKKKRKTKPKRTFADILAGYESNESEKMETVICSDANLEKGNDASSGSDQLDSLNMVLVNSNSLSETSTDYLQSDVAAYTTVSENVSNCRRMPIVCTN